MEKFIFVLYLHKGIPFSSWVSLSSVESWTQNNAIERSFFHVKSATIQNKMEFQLWIHQDALHLLQTSFIAEQMKKSIESTRSRDLPSEPEYYRIRILQLHDALQQNQAPRAMEIAADLWTFHSLALLSFLIEYSMKFSVPTPRFWAPMVWAWMYAASFTYQQCGRDIPILTSASFLSLLLMWVEQLSLLRAVESVERAYLYKTVSKTSHNSLYSNESLYISTLMVRKEVLWTPYPTEYTLCFSSSSPSSFHPPPDYKKEQASSPSSTSIFPSSIQLFAPESSFCISFFALDKMWSDVFRIPAMSGIGLNTLSILANEIQKNPYKSSGEFSVPSKRVKTQHRPASSSFDAFEDDSASDVIMHESSFTPEEIEASRLPVAAQSSAHELMSQVMRSWSQKNAETLQYISQHPECYVLQWTAAHISHMAQIFRRASLCYSTRFTSNENESENVASNLSALERWQHSQFTSTPKFSSPEGFAHLQRVNYTSWLISLHLNVGETQLFGFSSTSLSTSRESKAIARLLLHRGLMQPFWASYVLGTEIKKRAIKIRVHPDGFVQNTHFIFSKSDEQLSPLVPRATSVQFSSDRFMESSERSRAAQPVTNVIASILSTLPYEFDWNLMSELSFLEFLRYQVVQQLRHSSKKFTDVKLWPFIYLTSLDQNEQIREKDKNDILVKNTEWDPLLKDSVFHTPFPIPVDFFKHMGTIAPLQKTKTSLFPNKGRTESLENKDLFVYFCRALFAPDSLDTLISQRPASNRAASEEEEKFLPPAPLAVASSSLTYASIQPLVNRVVFYSTFSWQEIHVMGFVVTDSSPQTGASMDMRRGTDLWDRDTLQNLQVLCSLQTQDPRLSTVHSAKKDKIIVDSHVDPIGLSSRYCKTLPLLRYIQLRPVQRGSSYAICIEVWVCDMLLVSLSVEQIHRICSIPLEEMSTYVSKSSSSSSSALPSQWAWFQRLILECSSDTLQFLSTMEGQWTCRTTEEEKRIPSERNALAPVYTTLILCTLIQNVIRDVHLFVEEESAPQKTHDEREWDGSWTDTKDVLTLSQHKLLLQTPECGASKVPVHDLLFAYPDSSQNANMTAGMYQNLFQTLPPSVSSSVVSSSVPSPHNPKDSRTPFDAHSFRPIWKKKKVAVFGHQHTLLLAQEMKQLFSSHFQIASPVSSPKFPASATHTDFVQCMTHFARILTQASLQMYCQPFAFHNARPFILSIPHPVPHSRLFFEWMRILRKYSWITACTRDPTGWWSVNDKYDYVGPLESSNEPFSLPTQPVSWAWNCHLTPLHLMELLASHGDTYNPLLFQANSQSTPLALKEWKTNQIHHWYRVLLTYMEDGQLMYFFEALQIGIRQAEQMLFAQQNVKSSATADARTLWQWKVSDLSHPRNRNLSVLLQKAMLHLCQLIGLQRGDFWWTVTEEPDEVWCMDSLVGGNTEHIFCLPWLQSISSNDRHARSSHPTVTVLQFHCRAHSEWKSLLSCMKKMYWKLTRQQNQTIEQWKQWETKQKNYQSALLQTPPLFRPSSHLHVLFQQTFPFSHILNSILQTPSLAFPCIYREESNRKYSVRERSAHGARIDSVPLLAHKSLAEWDVDQTSCSMVHEIKQIADDILSNKILDLSQVRIEWSSFFEYTVRLRSAMNLKEWYLLLHQISNPILVKCLFLVQTIHEVSAVYKRWWPSVQKWVITHAFQHITKQHAQEIQMDVPAHHAPSTVVWSPLYKDTSVDVFDWTQSTLVLFGLLSQVDRKQQMLLSFSQSNNQSSHSSRYTAESNSFSAPSSSSVTTISSSSPKDHLGEFVRSANLWIDHKDTIFNTVFKIVCSHPVFFKLRVLIVVSDDQRWVKETDHLQFVLTPLRNTEETLNAFDVVFLAIEFITMIFEQWLGEMHQPHIASGTASWLSFLHKTCQSGDVLNWLKKGTFVDPVFSDSLSDVSDREFASLWSKILYKHEGIWDPDTFPLPDSSSKHSKGSKKAKKPKEESIAEDKMFYSPANDIRSYQNTIPFWFSTIWNKVVFSPSLFAFNKQIYECSRSGLLPNEPPATPFAKETTGVTAKRTWKSSFQPSESSVSSSASPSLVISSFLSCASFTRMCTVIVPHRPLPVSFFQKQPALQWNHAAQDPEHSLDIAAHRWDFFTHVVPSSIRPNSLHPVLFRYMFKNDLKDELKEAWFNPARPAPRSSTLSMSQGETDHSVEEKEPDSWFSQWTLHKMDLNHALTIPFMREMCRYIFTNSAKLDSLSGDDECEWRFHVWFMQKWALSTTLEQASERKSLVECLLNAVRCGLIVIDANRFYEWILFQLSSGKNQTQKFDLFYYRKSKDDTIEWLHELFFIEDEQYTSHTASLFSKLGSESKKSSSSAAPASKSHDMDIDSSGDVPLCEEDGGGPSTASKSPPSSPVLTSTPLPTGRRETMMLTEGYFSDFIRILSVYEGNGELINTTSLFKKFLSVQDEVENPNPESKSASSTDATIASEEGAEPSASVLKRSRGRPPLAKPPPPQADESCVFTGGVKVTIPESLQAKLRGTSSGGASVPPTPASSPPLTPSSSTHSHAPSPSYSYMTAALRTTEEMNVKNRFDKWNKSMQCKYYDTPSDSLSLFRMDIRQVGYFFCQLWFNFKPKKYAQQIEALRQQQKSLEQQGAIHNASASYPVAGLRDNKHKLSEKEREYHLLTYKIQYLEAWVVTLIRVREMTLPDLNAEFNLFGAPQSYKTMNNRQYMCVGNEPRQPLDIRGVSGIYWTIHPEFMYQFVSNKIQDQRMVFSKILSPPSSSPSALVPFSFQSIDDAFAKTFVDAKSSVRNQWMVYPGHYHHVFWASNMRKFTQGYESCVWVFSEAEELKSGWQVISDSIKQTLLAAGAPTPVHQWSLRDVTISSLYSKNEMMLVESESMRQIVTSSSPMLVEEPFCDVFSTFHNSQSSSSSALSVLGALQLVAKEKQSILLVTLDALSYVPSSIVRKTDHFFVSSISHTKPVQNWIGTHTDVWLRNSKHIYVTEM